MISSFSFDRFFMKYERIKSLLSINKEKKIMRKKLFITGLALALCLFACGKTKSNEEKKTEIKTTVTEKETAETLATESQSTVPTSEDESIATDSEDLKEEKAESTIKEELAEIEKKDAEIGEVIKNSTTQSDINKNSEKRFTLWDDELNSIWNRLSDADREALMSEENRWIRQVDGNSKAAYLEYLSASMASGNASARKRNMTRKRVYELAAYLAKEKGESFEIPEEVKTEIENENPSLDEIFKDFEGEWSITKNGEGDVVIKSLDASSEGEAKWSVSYKNIELTDLNVYGFSKNNIVLTDTDRTHGAPSYCWIHIDIDGSNIRVCSYDGFDLLRDNSDSYIKDSIIAERK